MGYLKKHILISACGDTVPDAPYRWKRVFDVLGILILFPALLACFVLIAILIKAVSRGPIFFRQERVGYRGKKFLCYKFRTMHPQADTSVHAQHMAQLLRSDQPMRKLDSAGDKRLILFGRQLRASGLDELPQLINVLKGEMSIVGPRPCTLYEYDLYDPWHKERLNGLPGLTGYWQVNGKNRTTFDQMVEMDIHYTKIASPWTDFKIIAATFPTLLGQILEHVKARSTTAPGQRSSVPVAPSKRPDFAEVN